MKSLGILRVASRFGTEGFGGPAAPKPWRRRVQILSPRPKNHFYWSFCRCSPQQVQEIVELRDQLQGALKDLKLQFERIAQIQAQLDNVLSSAKRLA